MTSILGISAFYHDSAAALIIDGEIIAAAQEERFSRKKHDARYPHKAIEFVLMALKNFKGSEIYVPEMENFKILDLARAINPRLRIKYTGKKPGEKLHETLITREESKRIKKFKNYFIIYPEQKHKLILDSFKTKINDVNKTFEYKSNQSLIKNLEKIRKIVFHR